MSATSLRLILGDQLNDTISSLQGLDPKTDVVLMAEVMEEATYVPHHKQKIVLLFSAMRHFAMRLQERGVQVDYVKLDDPDNEGSFTGEVRRAISRHQPKRVVVTEPGEWRVWRRMQSWTEEFGCSVEICPDNRFFCSREKFAAWANGRTSLRMEYFYRQMRKETGWLMDGGQPEGGKWNYDSSNRKAMPKGVTPPAPRRFPPDDITDELIDFVQNRFSDHFGSLKSFGWAVTREQALEALEFFIQFCLPQFGDYQDAMKTGDDFLFHSVLSPYINCGLLLPREVCEAALGAYHEGRAPLSSVEGFVRQILGWREFIRGIYWEKMPGYEETNYLGGKRPLPKVYWTGQTKMKCMQEAIENTRRNAYAHHIQRLMVTGNFALLCGIAPSEIEAWYLAVYADAYDWVELPNTHGMVLHADGGLLGSKPYAASGSYINRMSDYCRGCMYSPKTKVGEEACPFNYLYWNFMMENESKLVKNPRMSMPYRTLKNMSEDRKRQIREDARTFLHAL